MGIGTIEQAKQAAAELATKNAKIIHHLPPELMIAGKPIMIYNVTPQKHEIGQGGMGTWIIPACEPGQKYSAPLPIPFIMSEGIPTDMDHIEFRQMAGSEFAKSIIGIGKHRHQTEDLRRWGVFIAAGDKPTAEELEEANKHFTARDLELIAQADGYYGDGPNMYNNITKQHREALDRCTARGLDMDEKLWHKTMRDVTDCPVCFQKVNKRAMAHIGPNGCGAVIDEAAVIKAKLRGYEHLWEPKAKKGAQAEA